MLKAKALPMMLKFGRALWVRNVRKATALKGNAQQSENTRAAKYDSLAGSVRTALMPGKARATAYTGFVAGFGVVATGAALNCALTLATAFSAVRPCRLRR